MNLSLQKLRPQGFALTDEDVQTLQKAMPLINAERQKKKALASQDVRADVPEARHIPNCRNPQIPSPALLGYQSGDMHQASPTSEADVVLAHPKATCEETQSVTQVSLFARVLS